MTKNTLAAALMVALVVFVAGFAWLALHHPRVLAIASVWLALVLFALAAWSMCRKVAKGIIEARRTRWEGSK